MPNVTAPETLRVAREQLNAFRASQRNYKGRFVQIFLALKFYQNELPSMYSGQYTPTEVIQTMLDDLYAKASRPLNDCVLVLFGDSFLARTGLQGPNNTTIQNTWRNNLNLQKGVGCYAPAADLSSITFLNQSRSDCRFLRPGTGTALNGGRCNLCLSGAAYRGEDHRKWLKIDPGGNGYATLDLMNTDNYVPYAAPSGNRIPLWPLIIALYHDANPEMKHGRREVELADFQSDFNFSDRELTAYFDASPALRSNQLVFEAIGAEVPPVVLEQVATEAAPDIIQTESGSAPPSRRRGERTLPEPILTGTPVAPPATNSGWEGEQYVAAALQQNGWRVYDVSRQRLGYDLLAQKGTRTRYIDVKSSVATCSPSMTGREWSQARLHRESYLLAIIENFNPTAQATIYWVPDPTVTCTARESMQVLYGVSRASWTRATIPLDAI
jgi:hypothetical protein